jgi:hypothetical protein
VLFGELELWWLNFFATKTQKLQISPNQFEIKLKNPIFKQTLITEKQF